MASLPEWSLPRSLFRILIVFVRDLISEQSTNISFFKCSQSKRSIVHGVLKLILLLGEGPTSVILTAAMLLIFEKINGHIPH